LNYDLIIALMDFIEAIIPAKKLYEAVDLVPLSCMVIGSRRLSTLKR